VKNSSSDLFWADGIKFFKEQINLLGFVWIIKES
jgi:hypothetical protein